MNELKCISRAKTEVESGRLWRAKEILQGNISTKGYVPELYEAFGCVLLQMKDLREAGRYLFLSGVRNSDYIPAIEVYLQRHRSHWRSLVGSFPKSAQRGNLKDYPEPVATYLASVGAPQKLHPPFSKPKVIEPESMLSNAKNALGCGLTVGIIIPIIFSLVISAVGTISLSIDWLPWWVWVCIGGISALGHFINLSRKKVYPPE